MDKIPEINIYDNLPCQEVVKAINQTENGTVVNVKCETYSMSEVMDILAAMLCRDPDLADYQYKN